MSIIASANATSLIFGGHSPIAIACAKTIAKNQKVILFTRKMDVHLLEEIKGCNIDLKILDLNKLESIRDVINEVYSSGWEVSSALFFQRYRSEKSEDFILHCNIEIWSTQTIIDLLAIKKQPNTHIQILISSSPAAEKILIDQDLSYHIIKSGQEVLVRFNSVKLAKKLIAINAIRIGSIVIKERAANYWDSIPETVNKLMEISPTGSLLTSRSIGNVFAHFIQNKNHLITGQVLTVDDGFNLLDAAQASKSALD